MLSFFSPLVCRFLYASAYAIHYIIYYEKRKTHSRNSLKSISKWCFCFLYIFCCCCVCGTCQWESEKRKNSTYNMNILMQYECVYERKKNGKQLYNLCEWTSTNHIMIILLYFSIYALVYIIWFCLLYEWSSIHDFSLINFSLPNFLFF